MHNSFLKNGYKRSAFIFYPITLYTGIIIAIGYCFIFWKLNNLGRYRIPLFSYSVVVQLSFLLLYAWMHYSFKDDINFAREYTGAFGIGIMVFYFLMIIPFFIALGIHTYKGIQKLEITKRSKGIMLALVLITSIVFSVTGFYMHLFFYYGFAP